MRKYLLALVVLTGFAFTAQAAQKGADYSSHVKSISVVAPSWEGFTNADGTGLYWEVIKAVYEPENIAVKTSNVPWNRAVKMVSKYGVYNAIVGETTDTGEDLLFTDFAIDVEYMSVLTMANRNIDWNGPSSFANKTVGWMKEYEVIEEDQRNFELVEYRTVAQGLELLEAGKIDFMVEEWDEIAETVAEQGLDMSRYVMNEMPDGEDVFLVFSNTPLSQTLIQIYNERMPILYQEQTLQAIYKKWGMDIPWSAKQALEK